MDDDAAATWGALNEVRRLREENYRAYFDWRQSQYGRTAAIVGTVLLVVGLVILAGLLAIALVQGWPPDVFTWVVFTLVAALGPGLLLVAGTVFVLRSRWHRRLLERYDGRRAAQVQWRLALDELARRWSGQVETDGVGPACRFLIKHWSDRSRQLVVNPISGDSGDRLTLTAVAHDHPVLVQVTDLLEAGGDFSPPVLVVLVACPLDPDGARLKPGETNPGRWLAEQGFRIGWTRAGAYASQAGPADALLNEADLDQVVSAVALLCADAPAGVRVAAPAPVVRNRSAAPDLVAEEFLAALSSGDGVGALSCADPDLTASLVYELRPEDVISVVDSCSARPVTWKPGSLMIAGAGRIHRFATTYAKRPADEVEVHLWRRDDGWRVCGYKAGPDLILGIEHDDSD